VRGSARAQTLERAGTKPRHAVVAREGGRRAKAHGCGRHPQRRKRWTRKVSEKREAREIREENIRMLCTFHDFYVLF